MPMDIELLEKVAYHKKHLRMVAYSLEGGIEMRLKDVLTYLLETRRCQILVGPVYSCVMELLNNALKANFKNIYFENYKSTNISNTVDYATALRLFKLELNRSDEHALAGIARIRQLSAEVVIVMYDDILHVSVCNPVPMTSIEYQKVRQKLSDAEKKYGINEYFLMNERDPYKEGAGLGLVLVAVILKSLGISQSNFSIKSDKSSTVASLVIPLTREVLAHYYRNTGNEAAALGVYQ